MVCQDWTAKTSGAVAMCDNCSVMFTCCLPFQELLWGEAADAATDRRRQTSGLKTAQKWDNVLVWERPPVAGQTAVALYNKAHGAIR